MSSESWLIIELGVILFLLAILCFFFVPEYEKGAWILIGGLYGAFNNVIGYKFGRSLPQQIGDPKPGQTTRSKTLTDRTISSDTEA